ncbi:MAG: 4Fe-4S dicluster domain-containing protein [Candidatus Eremiobacteraeota bacterium]|nr:4Fe-4S dicluster domain-containing protein [Candidatus Eremiobacteraeota bacterium]MCW5869938.1 4Fe-4S dicluster domain-containing protein [Candidatus Eremiobacteraeota bacterium]
MLTGALGRRTFLQLLSGGALALMAGCSPRPRGELLPYVVAPEAGEEQQIFATALPYLGMARGMLVESVAGRPIKIDGNPSHPASLGGSDIYAQAALFDLFDEKRLRMPLRSGRPAAFRQMLDEVKGWLGAGAEGLHILTRTVASPALQAAISALGARWHRYDPIWPVSLACRRPAHLRAPLQPCLVAFDADPLGMHPEHLRLAREWSALRPRLYVLESTPTLTGGRARQRHGLPPVEVERGLWALAARFGMAPAPEGEVRVEPAWLDRVEAELKRGDGLLLAGETLSPQAQALALRLNRRLNAPVDVLPALDQHLLSPNESLHELEGALQAGEVKVLLILEGNPVYERPQFANYLSRAGLTLHHSRVANETSQLCHWVLPASHELESWGDLRAYDGLLSLVQPLIQPLHQSTSGLELLARLKGDERDGYALIRDFWRGRPWDESLRRGFLEGSHSRPLEWSEREPGAAPAPVPETVLIFRPDAGVVDGQLAGNAWLQECPRPFSKLVWGNAVQLGRATAESLGVANGDLLELKVGQQSCTLPAWVEAWQPEGTLAVHFGFGGERGGYDVYPLRAEDAWQAAVGVRKVEGRVLPISTQAHHQLDGRAILQTEAAAVEVDLYGEKAPSESEAWGMVIDLEACIGCNACTVACQVENNIPTVGPAEAARGRELHWIRVDRYDHGERVDFQPVPCQHCENAPCEKVCPVGATMHSHDGLNQMVYNRCVGTRYCANNCPYKVRRFNFFDYWGRGSKGEAPSPPLNLGWFEGEPKNPEVTVRDRGVMEKCTYCVQRISAARIGADKENRAIADGEVVTACQAACPSQAIVFGNLADSGSRVARARSDRRNFALLGELNTKPRTTYLSRPNEVD